MIVQNLVSWVWCIMVLSEVSTKVCLTVLICLWLEDRFCSIHSFITHYPHIKLAMKAKYEINAGDITVIRPLCYCRESLMTEFAKQNNLPVINENCPACFEEPKERAVRNSGSMCIETIVFSPSSFWLVIECYYRGWRSSCRGKRHSTQIFMIVSTFLLANVFTNICKKLMCQWQQRTMIPIIHTDIRHSLIPLMNEDLETILRCYTEEAVRELCWLSCFNFMFHKSHHIFHFMHSYPRAGRLRDPERKIK